MNKLAFFGVIILGLVLLVTHLVVTLIVGLGPQFVTNTYDTMRDIEAIKEKLTVEFKKTGEELEAKYQEEIKKRKLQDDTPQKQAFSFENREELKQILDDPNKLLKWLDERLRFEPRKIEKSFSIRWEGPTYELDAWVAIYGLIGSLMIISGTAFLAIALLKQRFSRKED